MPTGTLPKLIGAPSRDARRASPVPLTGDGGSPRWTGGTRSTWPDRRTLPSVARTAVNLRFSPSKPISTCATAREMAPTAPSSPGKASMTVPPPAAAAGPLWGAPAVWSVTSSSTKGMTPASSPSASDFFNNLLSGSLSPTAAGAQQIENGVHRRPHFGPARPPTGPRRRDHWLQPLARRGTALQAVITTNRGFISRLLADVRSMGRSGPITYCGAGAVLPHGFAVCHRWIIASGV